MRRFIKFGLVYLFVICLMITGVVVLNEKAADMVTFADMENRKCIVIDAGHGGIDGGATSCTGVLESTLNLHIALRLNDLLHLLGYKTKMIRTDDRSVYTSGDTIAAQKVSDLKERVQIINETQNAILISIHQNYYVESKYSGAQVFYTPVASSQELAQFIQSAFKKHLNDESNRNIKKANNIYLLEKIECTGVLIECGFLSNPQEEAALRNASYQKKISCVISSAVSTFLSNT